MLCVAFYFFIGMGFMSKIECNHKEIIKFIMSENWKLLSEAFDRKIYFPVEVIDFSLITDLFQ